VTRQDYEYRASSQRAPPASTFCRQQYLVEGLMALARKASYRAPRTRPARERRHPR